MAPKGESFFQKRLGWIFGGIAVLIVVAVGITIADVDFNSIFNPQSAESETWETFIIGNWEWTDRDGGDQYFQFHPNGRYDYYLKINPQGGGFGNYKLLEATEDRATFEMVPAADPDQKWNMYVWRRDFANVDIRMGSPEGEDFTRLSRL